MFLAEFSSLHWPAFSEKAAIYAFHTLDIFLFFLAFLHFRNIFSHPSLIATVSPLPSSEISADIFRHTFLFLHFRHASDRLHFTSSSLRLRFSFAISPSLPVFRSITPDIADFRHFRAAAVFADGVCRYFAFIFRCRRSSPLPPFFFLIIFH